MPPTLTNRELKNKSTGIDIIVPEYQVIPGKIVNTVLYHVIVITRLFYFKTRQHKESDLVQFAVAKKYEEVEDLHTCLVAKFPSVSFPSLPKMSLIVTERTLNERKKFLEKLLTLVARTPKLCASTPVLTFLEVSKISIKQNELKTPEPEKPKEELPEEKKEDTDRDIFGVAQYDDSDEESGSEESEQDPEDAVVADMKRPRDSQPVKETTTPVSAGDGHEKPTDEFLKSSGKFSFGSHDVNETDVSDLFIPDEARKSDNVKLFESDDDDDDPDLLKIDDDLDKLLNVSKKTENPAPSPKPRAPPKPDLKPRPTPKPRFVQSSSGAETDFLTKPEKQVKPEKPDKPEKLVKPEKPDKPEKLRKPEKPVKSVKSVVPPKPKPRARSKVTSEEKSVEKPKSVSADVSSRSKSDSLDDIFGKPSRKDLFSGTDDDDEDLFKPEAEAEDIDDITKYIEKNIGNFSNDDVDLFS